MSIPDQRLRCQILLSKSILQNSIQACLPSYPTLSETRGHGMTTRNSIANKEGGLIAEAKIYFFMDQLLVPCSYLLYCLKCKPGKNQCCRSAPYCVGGVCSAEACVPKGGSCRKQTGKWADKYNWNNWLKIIDPLCHPCCKDAPYCVNGNCSENVPTPVRLSPRGHADTS